MVEDGELMMNGVQGSSLSKLVMRGGPEVSLDG